MKCVRFESGDGVAAYGVVNGDKVNEISNSPIGQDYSETDSTYDLQDIKILAPTTHPSKMLCLALNYGSHLLGADKPTRPEPFY